MARTMGVYFDLESPDPQMAGLANYLESFNGYSKVGDRLWFVETDKTAAQVRDEINELPFMSQGFRSLVWRVGQDWASHAIEPDVAAWISNNWIP